MGDVDLSFSPHVPVTDANVALGRRHDRRVASDTPGGLLQAMRAAGVSRAVVYSPHAANYDASDGNVALLEAVSGIGELVPQFVCAPTFDKGGGFEDLLGEAACPSVRMLPLRNNYPFVPWVVGTWLMQLTELGIPLWLSRDQIHPPELHATLRDHVDLQVVLCEVEYHEVNWLMPLMDALPNLNVELSRFVLADGVRRLVREFGAGRVIFGSRFPDSPMPPQIYALHRLGLSDEDLAAVCAGNVDRILKGNRR